MLLRRISALLLAVSVGALSIGVADTQAALSDILATIEARRASLSERLPINLGNNDTPSSPDTDDTTTPPATDTTDEDDEEPACDIDPSLSLGRPQLQWRNGALSFIPVVNIAIRTRGDHTAPTWTATLAYNGSSSYSAEEAVPAGTSFSAQRTVASGMCGTRYDFRGYQLPAVSLAGIVPSLVGLDEQLDGAVVMEAALTVNGESDHEKRAFEFEVEPFGQLDVDRSWQRVR